MINDLGELRKLLRLCRAQGVTKLEFDNVKLELGDLPQEQSQSIDEAEALDAQISEQVGMPDDLAGIDPMAFYSVGAQ